MHPGSKEKLVRRCFQELQSKVSLRTGDHLTHKDDRNKTQTEEPQTTQRKKGEARADKLLTALWRGRKSVWGQTPQNRGKHSCMGPLAGSWQERSMEAEQLSQSTGQLGQRSPSRRGWNPPCATEQQAALLQKTWPAAEGTGWTLVQHTMRQSQPPVNPNHQSTPQL